MTRRVLIVACSRCRLGAVVRAQSFDKSGTRPRWARTPPARTAASVSCIVKEPLDYQRFTSTARAGPRPAGSSRGSAWGRTHPERLLTDSEWQKRWEKRVVDCGAVEPTQILGAATPATRL